VTPRRREPLLPPRGVAVALLVAAVSIGILILARPQHGTNGTVRATDTSVPTGSNEPTSTTATTVPATATTIDPGTLPQTTERPIANDPAEQARAKVLFDAIVADDPIAALPAFFPKAAYLQVKALANPAADYQNRLITEFTADIHALHAKVAPAGTRTAPAFVRLDVVATPVWVKPGVEYNKGSYWRVYDSQLRYTAGGLTQSLPIKSLISWRGQWYVVHLVVIK